MQKNDKGQLMIRGVKELPPAERKRVHWHAALMGTLFLGVYTVCFALFGSAPYRSPSLVFYYSDWGMIFVFAAVVCYCGAYLGLRLAVYVLGYVLPTQQQAWADHISQAQAFYSSDETHYPTSSSYNSYMSINPGSGLPMSGSSGVDTRGNPFGTNAW